ncbi:GntR family transcriptional regulator [Kutzneria sp. NPDC052558]|uniref:GntR family transcriptional regulator n=1 Tax=Kutzneria sp. NPDC052558 TaxID=3364121 RepID=UPI0037C50041
MAETRVDDVAGSVLDSIRQAILDGRFAPGQRLVEAELCARYDAPRGAVRAALIELSHERLVERSHNRSAVVRSVSPTEAIEITEVRMCLEGLCAAKAAERVTESEVQELRALAQDMRRSAMDQDETAYGKLNAALHVRVRDIAGQSVAAETLTRLRAQAALTRLNARTVQQQYRTALRRGGPQYSLPDHLAIIDEICARSPDGAERAMRRHWSNVIDALQALKP